jgi:hypothetical protein
MSHCGNPLLIHISRQIHFLTISFTVILLAYPDSETELQKIYRKEQTMFSFYKVVEALEGIFRSDPKERIQTLQKHIKDCEIAKKNCPRLVKLHSKEWGHEYSDLKSCYGHWNDEISSSGEEIQKLK